MDKSPDAFRTISEVAELLETPAHVLRFWESRFPQIKPVKRAGGRRYYRPADLALLSGIRRLLHDEGLTIRGVQKILREQGVRHVSGLTEEDDGDLRDLPDDDSVGDEPIVSSAPIPLFPAAKAPTSVIEAGPAASAPEPTPLDDTPTDFAVQSHDIALPDEAHEDVVTDPVQKVATEPEDLDEAALQAAITGPTYAESRAAQPAPTDSKTPVADTEPELDLGEDEAPPAHHVTEQSVSDSAAAQIAVGEDDALEPESLQIESRRDEVTDTAEDVAVEAQNDIEDVATERSELTETSAPIAEVTQPAPDQGDVAAKNADVDPPRALPGPLPAVIEISGHWLAADLRALRRKDLAQNRDAAAALFSRLEKLRNRVGDLGRVPRR